MSLGYTTTKNDIDARAGGLAVDLRNIFQAAQAFKLMVDALTDQELTARGYDATDIGRLRSGAGDFDHLAEIYLGTAAGVQATPLDFRRFTKFWLGTA
jgi:hypothetical protein